MSVGTRPAEPASSALKPGDLLQEQRQEEPLHRHARRTSANVSTFATVKLRRPNSSSGSIGAGVRSS